MSNKPEAAVGIKARGAPPAARFAVVSNPGTLFQRIEEYCSTFNGAVEAKECYDEPADIMRVLPGGELTTEF